MVDEAVHGPGLAEHVLVHESWDEIGREGDHKGLERVKPGSVREFRARQDIYHSVQPIISLGGKL